MKLSDIKGEEALDIVADLIEPIAEIAADKKIKELRDKEASKAQIAAYLIRNHKKEVIYILAILDMKKVEEYEVSLVSLPKKLLEIFNDEDFMDLFISQEQNMESDSSGPATENITENQ